MIIAGENVPEPSISVPGGVARPTRQRLRAGTYTAKWRRIAALKAGRSSGLRLLISVFGGPASTTTSSSRHAPPAFPDPDSPDLLITITAELEKQAWMFQAESA
ncbi:hypothetical protein GCM10023205_48230 [Yinghuangia aomiensis]|uniref:Uncharacterized protein n=1 Tax=Yinghuangia aomiensis TaxID=676205 RepID=A0ABP9HPX9_9ACTN